MGLDMYLYAAKAELIRQPVDFSDDGLEPIELHYWRKHPNLHGWMEKLYRRKGGQCPQFNLVTVQLVALDLDALEKAIETDALPETVGFFFGTSKPERKLEDREAVAKGRAALANRLAVFYTSSW